MNIVALHGVTIRRAVPGDAEVLAALLSEMDGEQDASHRFSPTLATKIMETMERYPEFHAYLALDEHGVPVGTFSLMVFSSLSHGGSRQAMLDAVVVTHSQRGRGVGEAMLKQALNLAAASGCYKMSLSSNLKRADAHRFYERLGFSQHGISFNLSLK
jgi:GNAT superfamily N-acetyltransferase